MCFTLFLKGNVKTKTLNKNSEGITIWSTGYQFKPLKIAYAHLEIQLENTRSNEWN